MKRILLHNWKIKLGCLAMASVVWYVIYLNVKPGAEERPNATERQKR